MAETETLFRHPLHPYTKALLSAVPVPSPDERQEEPPVIYDESVHDYSVDQPAWVEIEPGHMILGNQKELAEYRELLVEAANGN